MAGFMFFVPISMEVLMGNNIMNNDTFTDISLEIG